MRRKFSMGDVTCMVRMATLLVIHAAGAGLASPSVLMNRNAIQPHSTTVEWLPNDNQTIYKLKEGEIRRLELNTSNITKRAVFLTISPCGADVHWMFYRAHPEIDNGVLKLVTEYKNDDAITISAVMSKQDRYVLQLTSVKGGTTSVSVRGESPKTVRLRMRSRSKRRLSANWDPSPIDPHVTSYCVVASHRRNYTSLCAARYDQRCSRLDSKSNRLDTNLDQSDFGANRFTVDSLKENVSRETFDVDNKIDFTDDGIAYNVYGGQSKKFYRRKKFSRSTRVTDDDPMITCVGDRTHLLIENLDPNKVYHVSIFGVGRDRTSGSLLGAGSFRPRRSTAKSLRENIPYKTDIRGGKSLLYYKSALSSGGGLWLAVTTCGGAVDVVVMMRGTRLQVLKNIDRHLKFFVPAPSATSSLQETSDESSIQFDSSSSEETKVRYIIKVIPSRREFQENPISLEIVASSSRWGVNMPELASHDGAIVRELRPQRSCHSIDIAFIPATHINVNVIRYCIYTREIMSSSSAPPAFCEIIKHNFSKALCINDAQKPTAKVIIQKIDGLRSGRRYALQVIASTNGKSVPFNTLVADTKLICDNK